MTETKVKRMNYADYAAIPADDKRHEIIEGEWYMTPAPELAHQRVSRNLQVLLHLHVVEHRLGEVLDAPVDVVLSEHTVVQPDLLFVSAERASILTVKNVRGAPDLVVEILSPSTAAIDRGEKRAVYEGAGVREYWIVDPAASSFELHEFSSPRRTRVYTGDQSFESALLPGLTVRLADVFRRAGP